uniref:Putative ovule protein n=1 Tax=Solanum chacoense TaxID=4108 RepID=A0A0V0H4G4_SOLCH
MVRLTCKCGSPDRQNNRTMGKELYIKAIYCKHCALKNTSTDSQYKHFDSNQLFPSVPPKFLVPN